MGQRQSSAIPGITDHRLNQLTNAIDKNRLIRKIIEVYAQIRKIEALAGPSKESQLLRLKITRLQTQLAYTRSLANKG